MDYRVKIIPYDDIFDRKKFYERLVIASGNKKENEIAKDIHVSCQTVNDWSLCKKKPSIETLMHIANVYSCKLDFLLGVEESNSIMEVIRETLMYAAFNDDRIEFEISGDKCIISIPTDTQISYNMKATIDAYNESTISRQYMDDEKKKEFINRIVYQNNIF